MKVESIQPRLTDISGLMSYCGVGRNSALQLAQEAGAALKVGRRTVYDLRLIDLLIDDLPKKTDMRKAE